MSSSSPKLPSLDPIIAPQDSHNPQSPNTLTLEPPTPNPSPLPQSKTQHNPFPEIQIQIQDDPEPEVPLPSLSPRITDLHVSLSSSSSRRPPKRSKKNAHKRRAAQEKKSLQKLEVLVETLNPIPFVPSKTLDFHAHESLLKRLGLWDFVHIEFDRTLRPDLIRQLIASYNPALRCSYVNSVRVRVNRADLARALKLPVRKFTASDSAVEALPGSAEAIGFIEELVSNWVLLHEDTWMMPNEVLNWTKVIKEGHLEKVDWAGLLWFMLEKELVQEQLGDCYYASHLQYLIRSQREQLFREESSKVEDEVTVVEEVKDDEEELEEEEEDGSGDVKMGVSEEFHGTQEIEEEIRGRELEEDSIELSLGQENVEKVEEVKVEAGVGVEVEEEKVEVEVEEEKVEVEVEVEEEKVEVEVEVEEEKVEVEKEKEKEKVGDEDVMDFEECREENKEEEGEQWFLDGKSNVNNVGNVGDFFLRRCNTDEVKDFGCEEGRKEEDEDGEEEGQEEEEGGEEVGGFHLLPKVNSLEGLASGSLIQAMEVAQNPFSSGIELRDNLAGEFLSSRDDSRMVSGSCSLFGNGNKRGIDHENENENAHNSLNGGNKRLRGDGQWDGKPTDFYMCMEQVQHWLDKAKMMYAAKEQASEESTMHQQILLNEVHQRDGMIEHLRRAKFDEQQKRQVEVYRLERELYMMGNILDGYRKALKDSHRTFSEYRARCPQPEEPLYKDVPGSGGLVLSTMELEKQRLKQEQEERMNRLVIEKKVKDFEEGWNTKFEVHFERINMLSDKLLSVEKEVKLLKESSSKCAVFETSEGAPIESEGAPIESEGAPTESEGAPTESEGAPTESEGAPIESEGAPIESEGAPIESEGAPIELEGAPIESESAPMESESAPMESESAPVESEGAPIESEGAPMESEGAPIESEDAPKESDGAANE